MVDAWHCKIGMLLPLTFAQNLELVGIRLVLDGRRLGGLELGNCFIYDCCWAELERGYWCMRPWKYAHGNCHHGQWQDWCYREYFKQS